MNNPHKNTHNSSIISQKSQKSNLSHKLKTRPAFTIVELLIVVVVIAVLAAITIVAYNGITNQAKDSALKSDLSTTSKKLKLDKVDTGSFPSTKPSYTPVSIQYTGGGDSFCITASKDGKAFYMTQDSTIQDGECPVEPPVNGAAMQSVSPAQCQALPVYTGSNPTALRTLTDNRGGTTRSYTVTKLADNKCWMLDNLKLGSTASSITLTPADSNVTANFTLPQLSMVEVPNFDPYSNPVPQSYFDTPYAYGPVPGDTGAGATNYGYLYNFSAATAGATRTSLPRGNGTAPNSICPANWRLPSGGNWNDTTNEFSNLNARIAGLSGVTDADYTSQNYTGATFVANWQDSSRFKGVRSGGWQGSFVDQGLRMYLWSRSAHPGDVNVARSVFLNSGFVDPASNNERYRGLAIRCLLN